MLATIEEYEATSKKFTSVEDKSYNDRKCKCMHLANGLDPSCRRAGSTRCLPSNDEI